MDEERAQPEDNGGEEGELDWRETVEGWRKGIGAPSEVTSDDFEVVRGMLIGAHLQAALQAKEKGDAEAQERYLTAAESALRSITPPEDFGVLVALGCPLAGLDRPRDAIGYLLRAVRLASPAAADEELLAHLHHDLWDCYESLGLGDLAAPWAHKWAEWAARAVGSSGAYHNDAQLHYELGIHYFDYGKYERAAEEFGATERLGLEGENLWWARQARAYAFEAMGCWEDAIPIWESLRDRAGTESTTAHFAEMLGYARGRLDAKLKRRARTRTRKIIVGMGMRRGVVEAGSAPAREVEAGTHQHELTRLRLLQVEEKIVGHLVRVEQTIDQRFDDLVRRVVRGREEKLEAIESELERTVFGETWDRLETNARRFLVSAELLYQEQITAEAFDLGLVAVGFGKAVEAELEALVLGPFQAWLQASTSISEVKVGKDVIQVARVSKLGLGQTAHLLRGREIRQWVENTAPVAEELLLRLLPDRLRVIAEWRNPSGHTGCPTVSELAKRRSEILGTPEDPGLLKQLVDALAAKDPT
jgi:tetratricopeptide (TPR) repeat protein